MTGRALAWVVGRVVFGMPTRFFARTRAYGRGNIPPEGGLVLAVNHLHWIDITLVGTYSPRDIDFVAKVEAHRMPGLGQLIRSFGTLSVRRGESDRDAVRQMRRAARDGRVIGLFVEGTRQRSGRPGVAQPGAAMVAIQEQVPVVPVAVYGTQFWKPGNFAPCSVAFGRPMDFRGRPKNGRGYKEATAEIQERIHALFDWLAGVHAQGRPKGLTPP